MEVGKWWGRWEKRMGGKDRGKVGIRGMGRRPGQEGGPRPDRVNNEFSRVIEWVEGVRVVREAGEVGEVLRRVGRGDREGKEGWEGLVRMGWKRWDR